RGPRTERQSSRHHAELAAPCSSPSAAVAVASLIIARLAVVTYGLNAVNRAWAERPLPVTLARPVIEKVALVHTSRTLPHLANVSRTTDPVVPAGLASHSHATFSPGACATVIVAYYTGYSSWFVRRRR
ncbi:MAG: hypothetical protein M3Y09_15525, partial [Actinomycetota bacterium]|nr:hypothetical protein [Actinomycetota bacterium]